MKTHDTPDFFKVEWLDPGYDRMVFLIGKGCLISDVRAYE